MTKNSALFGKVPTAHAWKSTCYRRKRIPIICGTLWVFLVFPYAIHDCYNSSISSNDRLMTTLNDYTPQDFIYLIIGVGGIISKNRYESFRKNHDESSRKFKIGQWGIISKLTPKDKAESECHVSCKPDLCGNSNHINMSWDNCTYLEGGWDEDCF